MSAFIDSIKKKRIKIHNDEVRKQANNLFQIAENNGRLWITFDNIPCFPCEMLKKEPLEALAEIRELYVKRMS